MRADVAGKGELFEEFLHALGVFALVRIHLRIGAFQIGGAEHAGGSVSGAGHEDHIQVVALDHVALGGRRALLVLRCEIERAEGASRNLELLVRLAGRMK